MKFLLGCLYGLSIIGADSKQLLNQCAESHIYSRSLASVKSRNQATAFTIGCRNAMHYALASEHYNSRLVFLLCERPRTEQINKYFKQATTPKGK